MRPSVVFFLAFLIAVVNAHFQIQFPPPRGPFNATSEVDLCDGYTSPATNRTRFPLSGGFVTLKFSHGETWTAGVYVSTSQNPTKFDEFVLNNNLVTGTKPGNYCIPLDFSKSNVTGLSAGQNITIQLLWNGGDGPLYQCADLSLAPADSVNISSIKCENQTATPHSGQAPAASIAKSVMSLVALVALAGLLL